MAKRIGYILYIHSSSNTLNTFLENGSCQNSGCCCTITSLIIGFGCNRFNQLSTNVLESVWEFNCLSNSDTILCDFWSTKGLVNYDISSLWSKGCLDCISQFVTSFEHLLSAFLTKTQLLSCKEHWSRDKWFCQYHIAEELSRWGNH